MAYRLLAINVVGVFSQDNGRVSRATKEAIEYANKKKVSILLFSERQYPFVKKIAKALQSESHLVAHNGAYVISSENKPMYIQRISEEDTFDLIQFLESFDCQVTLESENFSVSNKGRLPATLVKRTLWQRTQKFLYSQYFVDSLEDHLLDERISPLSIQATFQNREERDEALQALINMFADVQFMSRDHNKIEIVAAGVSKWNSIVYIAEQLGISRSEIAVIGVSTDDQQAVQQAGMGIAMGNADPEVKEAADWITRTNRQEGIAYVVKELLRHQRKNTAEEMNKVD
ncbi:HAD family hydrolase [Bacillus sp. REN10]|uniref:HAD family hydrolase n=1 Tax=Bacillus sp. REN10 TaxID=2782541 RepID=UPI00193BFE42|nr:HAD family hydrolase [Bacillus sp. REN10]